MKISEVTKEDGIQCLNVIKLLSAASFNNISGKDMDNFQRCKIWLQQVAQKLAEQLKESEHVAVAVPPAPEGAQGGFRVKAMGPLPGKAQQGKPSKTKKRK